MPPRVRIIKNWLKEILFLEVLEALNTNLKKIIILFYKDKLVNFTMVSKTVCFSLVVFAVLVMTTAAKPFSEEDRGIVATRGLLTI